MFSPDSNFPHSPHGPHLNRFQAATLRLLLEAHDYALELNCDPWEFAVEIHSLRPTGVNGTHLRQLLRLGLLAQGIEQSEPGTGERRFRSVANLSLCERSCFVLTAAGIVCARNADLRAGGPEWLEGEGGKPVWNKVLRELRLDQQIIKRFKQPAANQELILATFEEEGWPSRIDDPLPPRTGQDPVSRLHSTINNLNRGHAVRLIQFQGGGDGESILWRWFAGGKAKAEREQGESSEHEGETG